MKGKELVRWGVPILAFIAYFKWGGFGLSFLLAGILFAIISALINWHKKDPHGFFVGVRAWIVLFLILPATVLTVITAMGAPMFLVLSFPVLLLTIWVYRANARKIEANRGRIGMRSTT